MKYITQAPLYIVAVFVIYSAVLVTAAAVSTMSQAM